MSNFQKSKSDSVVRLRAAGLSPASAQRITQRSGGNGVLLAVAVGLTLLFGGVISTVAFQMSPKQQTQHAVSAQSTPAQQTTPPPVMTAAKPPVDQLPAQAAAIVDNGATQARQVTEQLVAVSAPAPSRQAVADCVAELDNALSGIFFQFGLNSIEIPAENATVLSDVSEMIRSCETAYVLVGGHADSSGDDNTNFDLSWSRADQVLEYLAAMGVDENQLESVGFGARAPLSQGSDTEEAANRRVEFRVLHRRGE